MMHHATSRREERQRKERKRNTVGIDWVSKLPGKTNCRGKSNLEIIEDIRRSSQGRKQRMFNREYQRKRTQRKKNPQSDTDRFDCERTMQDAILITIPVIRAIRAAQNLVRCCSATSSGGKGKCSFAAVLPKWAPKRF
jgi:hypothetical protein